MGQGIPPGDNYLGLGYNGWSVFRESPALGVKPASSPNAIGTEIRNEATQGPNLITTNYPDSKVAKFDMIRMAFGCAVNGQVVGTGISCVVRATATKPNSDGTPSSIVRQDFRFQAPLLPLSPPPLSVQDFSDDFKGITDLRFTIINSLIPAGLDGTLLALVADNLSYKTYLKA